MQNLEGVCAVVSGAAGEVGSQVIRGLAERGASILAVDASEEMVEEAIAKLGLDSPDEIFVSALEGRDVVSWWDLANLVGSYFKTLNLFVHIAEPCPAESARTLSVESLRQAQTNSTESFLHAMARFEKMLVTASQEDEIGACVVAVPTLCASSSGMNAPDAISYAGTVALADAMAQEYSESGLNIRVKALPTFGDNARVTAKEILDLI